MFRLTIIIPLFQDTTLAAFEETLASVLHHRPGDCEILVVEEVAYSDPWNIQAEGVGFVKSKPGIHDGNGRKVDNSIDLLNSAIRQARGEIVHILYPGTEVAEGWAENALLQFESSQVGVVIPAVYDRRKSSRVFSFGVRYSPEGTLRTIRRSHWSQTPIERIVPHISAVFFRKRNLADIGYFDRTFLLQISYVDAAVAISQGGAETVVDRDCRIYVRPNLLPSMKAFTWGVQIEKLYFRWFGRYHPLSSFFGHLGSLAVDSWRHFPKMKGIKLLSGRCWGFICRGNIISIIRERCSSPGTQGKKTSELECTKQTEAVESVLFGQHCDVGVGNARLQKPA